MSAALPVGLEPIFEAPGPGVSYDAATRTVTWLPEPVWPGQWEQRFLARRWMPASGATALEAKATFHAFWPNTDLLPEAEHKQFLDREQTVVATTRIVVESDASGRRRPRPALGHRPAGVPRSGDRGGGAAEHHRSAGRGAHVPARDGRRTRSPAPGRWCRTAAGSTSAPPTPGSSRPARGSSTWASGWRMRRATSRRWRRLR